MHPLVCIEELAAHLDDPDWIVFDCRHDLAAPAAGEALYRAAHIPGARFAHLDRDLSSAKTGSDGRHPSGRHPLPARADFAAFLVAAGVNQRSTLIACDASSGLYASRLWWLGRWIGHAAVTVLDGGLVAWQGAGLPMTDNVPRPIAGDLRIGASPVSHVETEDVEANLSTQAMLVVDARAAERYRGEVEPLDPVAGHIPHAVNRPMARNLAADGRFKRASELRDDFDALLAGRDPDTLIHSCGSGVTACHNLLAMEVAGLRGASLYTGSWSAWCADPRRPVERGI